jgi:hypothetical protein
MDRLDKDAKPAEILRSLDDVSERMARILDEDTPRWRHASPRARMKKVNYNQLPFAESFATFKQQRADLIARLEKLPEAWERHALVYVPYYKTEVRFTVRVLAWGMADHEQGHCDQMEETAAALRKT